MFFLPLNTFYKHKIKVIIDVSEALDYLLKTHFKGRFFVQR